MGSGRGILVENGGHMSNAGALADSGQRGQGAAQDTAAIKHALTGLAGASIEWYDFLLYATAAALVFPTVFFPATLSPFIALIASFRHSRQDLYGLGEDSNHLDHVQSPAERRHPPPATPV